MYQAVLFDKDGTLFDFQASWVDWTVFLLTDLAKGDEALATALGAAIGFDLVGRQFETTSPAIAGTSGDLVPLLLPLLPGIAADQLERRLAEGAEAARMIPAVPLGPLLGDLRARGLQLGVATNDTERAARLHLTKAGILDCFSFVVGYDSGFGAKPGPGQCRAFVEALGIAPARAVMVGDSTHDLLAAAGAGLCPIGVLTGMAQAESLRPLAQAVLPDIGHLPAWLDDIG